MIPQISGNSLNICARFGGSFMCPQLQTLRCPDPPKWASLHFHSKPKSWQRTGADAGTRSSPSEPCPPAGEATPQGKGHQVRSTCDRGGRWAGPRPVGATQRPDRGNGGGGMGRVPQVWMELRANQGQEAGQWEVELGFEGTVSLALEEMVRKPKGSSSPNCPRLPTWAPISAEVGERERWGLSRGQLSLAPS